jgi:Leucine-rich repeat (LRR) protein
MKTKQYIQLLFIVLSLVATGKGFGQDIPATERQALIDLYNATSGSTKWIDKTGWNNLTNTTIPITTWGFGNNSKNDLKVTNGHVTEISLRYNNIDGSIPESFGDLQYLEKIRFDENNLSGVLPNSIGNLKSLKLLQIYSNYLNAPLPDSITDLVALESLNIQCNNTTSSSIFQIPSNIGNLTELKSLAFYYVKGIIPESITNLKKLENLIIWGVTYSGDDIKLTGTIPSGIGDLKNLTSLYITGNLSGSIPPKIAERTGMRSLSMICPDLSGDFNSLIKDMINLSSLTIFSNNITGYIPFDINKYNQLQSLSIGGENFTGTIPEALGNLPYLNYVQISGTQISDTIPSSMFKTGRTFRFPNNKFRFIDFRNDFSKFTANTIYTPQKKVDTPLTIAATAGVSTTLKMCMDDRFLTNEDTFQWYRGTSPNGVVIPGATSQTYTFTPTVADAGAYYCVSKNPTITALTLEREPITLTVNPATAPCTIPAAERQALIDFYNSTGGANWSNTANGQGAWPINDPNAVVTSWDPATNTGWYGVTVTCIDGVAHVTKIELSLNNLGGLLPSSIDSFTKLKILNLESNQLIGGIPTSVGQLLNLEFLNLSFNYSLSGTIPLSIGNLTKLRVLGLQFDALTGTIPTEIGNLIDLTKLDLTYNQLSGTIPTSIGNLTKLNYMDLAWNSLTGSIPSSIGTLNSLQILRLSGNQLSQSIPNSIGNLYNLIDFQLSDNQLSGIIPIEFGNLTKLENLRLENNQLSGNIPNEIGNLIKLQNLYMQNNQLTGSIPVGIGNLTILQNLYMQNNQLTGSIPVGIGNLTSLYYLQLQGNQLSDVIPSGLFDNSNLQFNFQDNYFRFIDFKNDFSKFTGRIVYSYQKKVDTPLTIAVTAGVSTTLTMCEDDRFLTNEDTFQWYKDGVAIAGATNREYTFTPTVNDAGVYYCLSKNPTITALTLEREPITLTVNPAGNACGDIPAAERQALIDLYYATEGANWIITTDGRGTWPISNPNATVTSYNQVTNTGWWGITVECVDGEKHITKIDLSAVGLIGRLPVSLRNITYLKELKLNTNLLYEIPSFIGDFTKLEILDLQQCNLSGTILREIGSLRNLTALYLGQNNLSGNIPTEIGEISNLNLLDLSYNSLSGFIPSAIFNKSNIGFAFSYNYFRFIDFRNDFSKFTPRINYNRQRKVDTPLTINTTVGASVTLKMCMDDRFLNNEDTFQWYKNGVALPGVTSREYTFISTANDAGTYYCVSKNSTISSLILEREPIILSLTPVGNSCIIPVLERDALIDLYNSMGGINWKNTINNQAAWPVTNPNAIVTSGIGNFGWYGVTIDCVNGEAHVTRIDLKFNNLRGIIPASISNLTNLIELNLSTNSLYKIPKYIGDLVKLERLDLQSTFSFGIIPTEIGKLVNLKSLSLGGNYLSGTIPTSVGNLLNLNYLGLSTNRLIGNIPTQIGELPKLNNLNLSNNKLYGIIPSTIFDKPNIYFEFRNNFFRFIDFRNDFSKFTALIAYFPQRKVDNPLTINITVGNPVSLKMCEDNRFLTNEDAFQWYKGSSPNGVAILGATSRIYTFTPTLNDSGTYYCLSKNPTITALTLEREPIILNVQTGFISCTATNPRTAVVKQKFLALLNKLKKLTPEQIPAGYKCPELLFLRPYLSVSDPAIYNLVLDKAGSNLSFAFQAYEDTTKHDVQLNINENDDVVTLNLDSYVDAASITPVAIQAQGTGNGTSFVSTINFCPQLPAVSCAATNPRTPMVKSLFLALVNKLKSLPVAEIGSAYFCPELKELRSYITINRPKIYNYYSDENSIRFSFRRDAFGDDYDVLVPNTAAPLTINDIDLSYFTTADEYADATVTLSDNSTASQIATVSKINFCSDDLCQNHIAIVLDESSSMTKTDKLQIARQISSFLKKQEENNRLENFNMKVSLVGMSNSDADVRTDHIIETKLTESSLLLFNAWLDKYKNIKRFGNTGVAQGSDFWRSGLDAVLNRSTVKPKHVFLITDGSQTADLPGLENTMKSFSNYGHPAVEDKTKPHLFVIGIKSGFYDYNEPNGTNPNTTPGARNETVVESLKLSLKNLLGLKGPDPAKETDFPIEATQGNGLEIDASDFMGLDNFELIGNEDNKNFLSDKLAKVLVNCGEETIGDSCADCFSFKTEPGKTYVVNAWVKEDSNTQVKTYTNPSIRLSFLNGNQDEIVDETTSFLPSGNIIDGWQRIWGKFTVPQNDAYPDQSAVYADFELINGSASTAVYFDDVRIYPVKGSMKTFVYDPENFRLMSELDENNYATYYEYDIEGGLVRVKKETAQGVKTIQETRSGSVIKDK